jgi:hypothetical protein
MILPFVFAPADTSSCSTMLPIVVYAGYCGFMVLSSTIEAVIYFGLKNNLKLSSGSSILSCNRYLLAKQWQGQLNNLNTYVHICYFVAMFRCSFANPEEGSINSLLSILLALGSLVILVVSNIRRVKFIWNFIMP